MPSVKEMKAELLKRGYTKGELFRMSGWTIKTLYKIEIKS